MDTTQLTAAVAALPAAKCPNSANGVCPPALDGDGQPIAALPPERIVSTCRPGEVDVTVRCRQCTACVHYVLDEATGQPLDIAVPGKHANAEGLQAKRADPPPPEAAPSAETDAETQGRGDAEPHAEFAS